MNQTITYEWTEALAKNAIATVYQSRLARQWVLPTAGLAMAALGGWSFTYRTNNPLELVIAVMGLIFIALSIKHWIILRRLVIDAKRLMSDPKVTVLFANDGLTVSTGNNRRTIYWKTVTAILDRKGFLLVYCGIYLVACLPKIYLTDALQHFVKSQTCQT